MKKAKIEDVEPISTTSPADIVRPLSPVLETTDLAINYFELAPTESFGFEYHRHLDQEEVFYVIQGTVMFETESDDVEVNAGEIIRFAPGEFQLGRNRGDERVIAFALGAPRDTEEIEYFRECPTCGEETIQAPSLNESQHTVVIECAECGSTTETIRL